MSNDFIAKTCAMKLEDDKSEIKMMGTLKNLIAYEELSDDDKKVAAEAGITLYSYDQLIAKGKESE